MYEKTSTLPWPLKHPSGKTYERLAGKTYTSCWGSVWCMLLIKFSRSQQPFSQHSNPVVSRPCVHAGSTTSSLTAMRPRRVDYNKHTVPRIFWFTLLQTYHFLSVFSPHLYSLYNLLLLPFFFSVVSLLSNFHPTLYSLFVIYFSLSLLLFSLSHISRTFLTFFSSIVSSFSSFSHFTSILSLAFFFSPSGLFSSSSPLSLYSHSSNSLYSQSTNSWPCHLSYNLTSFAGIPRSTTLRRKSQHL